MMANRLGPCLNSLISVHQSAFVKNMNIAESILVANEISHNILSKRSRGLIFKIDFAKAFDFINWDFLEESLRSMHFHENLIFWIKAIVSSAKPSVLVNGSTSREFSMKQGIRQGDPLSPMLFNIIGEMLHLFLVKANSLGIFEGVSVNNCKA